uniref:Solute carrier family 12 member 6 n=1 Tax=Trichuris muris TaxID=70415 RepID=A0A5S6Q8T5_TRIMR
MTQFGKNEEGSVQEKMVGKSKTGSSPAKNDHLCETSSPGIGVYSRTAAGHTKPAGNAVMGNNSGQVAAPGKQHVEVKPTTGKPTQINKQIDANERKGNNAANGEVKRERIRQENQTCANALKACAPLQAPPYLDKNARTKAQICPAEKKGNAGMRQVSSVERLPIKIRSVLSIGSGTTSTSLSLKFPALMEPPGQAAKDKCVETVLALAENGDRLEQKESSSPTPSVYHKGLALYEEDGPASINSVSMYLKSLSGVTNDANGAKKTNLGTIFGVYLPSIQHILGVQMFLRLTWMVGVGGVLETFAMVFLCCLCTFLTSISISAIATNGKIESGGTYYMLSRNLGPEFGGAIGILYYLANTVETAMFVAGAAEILLVYMAPDLPKFGTSDVTDPQMFNNFRLYGTAFLILIFIICCFGVKFVQFFAPVSLACVILSIIGVYIGAFVDQHSGTSHTCLLGESLLNPNYFLGENGTLYCNRTAALDEAFCDSTNETGVKKCDEYYAKHAVRSEIGIRTISGSKLSDNLHSYYMYDGESFPGHMGTSPYEVTQDIGSSFFVLLAIFFPQVTGIMTGANMSGDLKDPDSSIPVGTIAAQLTTSFIYLSFVILYGGTMTRAILCDKYGVSLNGNMVAAKLAWPDDWIVLIGSFTSCIGASLQCLCSSPRLLQSIAKDNLLPFLNPFSKVTRFNEPIRALVITALIAEAFLMIGGIDYVAPVVQVFFLISYCFVNLACALQTLLNVPNWRPRFRFYHWSLSVLGALLSLFIMFSTEWYYSILVLLLFAFLYKYIEYKGAKKEWGDGIRGLALSTAQYSLLRIEDSEQHPKNWRPQILVFIKVDSVHSNTNYKLLQFASQLKAGRGLTIVATITKGMLGNKADEERAAKINEALKENMKTAKMKGFTEVVLSEYINENVGTVLQCVGMASLRPNTVIVGWPMSWRTLYGDGSQEYYSFLDAVCRTTAANKCFMMVKGLSMFPDVGDQLSGNIDIWWIIHTGGLLVLLPFLLKQDRVWRNCKLRVFAVAQSHDNSVEMKRDLQGWMYNLRIEATVDVVELDDTELKEQAYEKTLQMRDEQRPTITGSDFQNWHGEQKEEKGKTEAEPPKSTLSSSDLAEEERTGHGTLASFIRKLSTKGSRRGSIDMQLGSIEQKLPDIGYDNPNFEYCDNVPDDTKQPIEHSRLTSSSRKIVRKMNTALLLNNVIRERSSTSRLIVLSLPKPPLTKTDFKNYMEYLEVLTEGLPRVLLVRGSGREVVTIYS